MDIFTIAGRERPNFKTREDLIVDASLEKWYKTLNKIFRKQKGRTK